MKEGKHEENKWKHFFSQLIRKWLTNPLNKAYLYARPEYNIKPIYMPYKLHSNQVHQK